MATAVQVKVSWDDQAARAGAQGFKNEVEKLGPTLVKTGHQGESAFRGIENAESRAHIAAKLLERTLGVDIPRSMGRVIASSSILGPILEGAFKLSIFAAALPILEEIGHKFIELTENLGGMTEEMKKLEVENAKFANEGLLHPKTLAAVNGQMRILHATFAAMRAEAQGMNWADMLAGALPGGLGSAASALGGRIADNRTRDAEARIEEMQRTFNEALDKLNEDAEKKREVSTKKQIDNTLKLEMEGLQRRQEQEANFIAQAGNAELQIRMAAMGDRERIEAEGQERIHQAQRKFDELDIANHVTGWEDAYKALQNEELAIRADTDRRLTEFDEKRFQAAADARQRELEEEARAQQRALEDMQRANEQMVQQMGHQFTSLFEAIGSGGIGRYILRQVSQLFGQILARWVATMRGMQGGGGGGGGILGAILGSLGLGGSRGGGGGAAGTYDSSGALIVSPLPTGGIAGNGFFGGATALGGGGIGFGSDTSGGSVFNSPGVFSAVGGVRGALGGAGGLAGLGALGAVLGGRAIGGGFGAAGAMVGAAGILGSLATAHQFGVPLSMVANPMLGSVFGGATGALVGYGVGSSHGPVAGSIGGVGAGALTGFLLGGPIGAGIGALAGLLGGLFGGFGGQSKRKRQANTIADQLLGQVSAIEDAYKSMQLDSGSALGQLEGLRSSGWEQLRALKGEGRGVFSGRVGPGIDAAEQHIRGYDAERASRGAMTFGPPQFAAGGWTGDGHGAMLAVLHRQEFVMNQMAAAKYRPQLEAMNRGGSPGGGGDTYIINAVDAASFKDMLRARGGMKAWSEVNREARAEGRSW